MALRAVIYRSSLLFMAAYAESVIGRHGAGDESGRFCIVAGRTRNKGTLRNFALALNVAGSRQGMAACAGFHIVRLERFGMAACTARMYCIFQGKYGSHVRIPVMAVRAVLRCFLNLRTMVADLAG